MTAWWDYVRDLAPGATKEQIAQRIGITGSTVTRWSQGRPAAPDVVIAAARAYGRSPLEALLAAGILTKEESQGSWQGRTVDDMDVLELVHELERRVAKIDGPAVLRSLNSPKRTRPDASALGSNIKLLEPDSRAAAFDPGHDPDDETEVSDT